MRQMKLIVLGELVENEMTSSQAIATNYLSRQSG